MFHTRTRPRFSDNSSDISACREHFDMGDNDRGYLLKDVHKHKYPKSVFFIVGNEFCERFSYYGMRTILSLYLKDMLSYSEEDATLIYHAFTMFCYFFPLIGAIIADSYLGKFRTIFYLSIVYAAGNIAVSAASSPLFGTDHQRTFTLIGLLFIAIGTGGIKPCVSAFGGDQFTLPQQAKQLAQFFSIFYFSINAGSLISTYITPILRHDVQCFDQDTCFPLAFGVPALLMVVALFVFLAGKKQYVCKEPQGNVIVDVSKCISHALMMKLKSTEKKEHWLDHASDRFDQTLISNTKAVLQVLFLFIPLPLFWALFDQQGSRWTFQATRMDGSLGWFTIKPDQMQVINPFLILAFIPLFDSVVYPCLAKCNLLVRPLQRLSVGGLLAAVSFVVSALVQAKLEATYPILPQEGSSQLRVFNGLNCDVELSSNVTSLVGEIRALEALQVTNIPLTSSAEYNLNFTVSSNCLQYPNQVFAGKVSLQEAKAVSMFISWSSGGLPIVTQISGFDEVEKPDNGNPKLRVLYNLSPFQNVLQLNQDSYSQNILLHKESSSTGLIEIPKTGEFKAILGNTKVIADIDLRSAGIYTLILESNSTFCAGNVVTVTQPNSVHMLWLLPQYIIITAAEIMFSITGLEFSFTQAPVSMKSLISAAWLLTVSFGNLVVVIISKFRFQSQVWEFLLFAALMVIDMLVFIIFAYRYKYYTPSDPETKEVKKEHP